MHVRQAHCHWTNISIFFLIVWKSNVQFPIQETLEEFPSYLPLCTSSFVGADVKIPKYTYSSMILLWQVLESNIFIPFHSVDPDKIDFHDCCILFLSLKCTSYIFKCIYFTAVTLSLTLNKEKSTKIQGKFFLAINADLLE